MVFGELLEPPRVVQARELVDGAVPVQLGLETMQRPRVADRPPQQPRIGSRRHDVVVSRLQGRESLGLVRDRDERDVGGALAHRGDRLASEREGDEEDIDPALLEARETASSAARSSARSGPSGAGAGSTARTRIGGSRMVGGWSGCATGVHGVAQHDRNPRS